MTVLPRNMLGWQESRGRRQDTYPCHQQWVRAVLQQAKDGLHVAGLNSEVKRSFTELQSETRTYCSGAGQGVRE